MKTLLLFLAGTLACGAQVTLYDTSILKAGNTWVYERDQEEVAAGQVWGGFSGTVTFTLDSVRATGDSILFRVIRQDSLRDKIATRDSSDSMVHRVKMTRDTTRYVFKGGFSPSVPFFAEGQMFSAGDAKSVYHGDTVRTRESTPSPPMACLTTQTKNVETIGRTRYVDRKSVGCGIYSWTYQWTLVQFAGQPFSGTDLIPVSIRAGYAASRQGLKKGLRHDGRGIWIEQQNACFDLKGQRVPALPR
jgi:hypothetical protein